MEHFQHKKSLGQNFLNSDVVPRWMCDAAHIIPGEIVVEIGPGTGALTVELLQRGAHVYAYEADIRAVAHLQEHFKKEIASGQLMVEHKDARNLHFADMLISSGTFKVVANIPYYLSGLLFRTCLTQAVKPSTLVFLVQKEVAKRVTSDISRGEKESLLSLSVQAFGTPEYVRTVSRGHFTPSPNVDSGIVAVRNITGDNFIHCSESDFFHLLHLGFGQKRKQLLGNLSSEHNREALEHVFRELGLNLTVRAEDVPLAAWLRLTTMLYPE